MVIGAFIILSPNLTTFRIGDLLIMVGVMFAPIGNFFQRRARTKVSSESILFIRSVISAIFVISLAFIFHTSASAINLKSSLLFLIINGVFLLGLSKILWIEGIHRINVTKANAINSLSPLLTLLFAFILLHAQPTIWQLTSFIPMFLGVLLLGTTKRINLFPKK